MCEGQVRRGPRAYDAVRASTEIEIGDELDERVQCRGINSRVVWTRQ